MRMRLVSYNVMNGGEGRADPIAEVLLAQRADVIAIHEAINDDVLARLAWRLKMEFVVADCDGGRVALYTSGRIIASMNVAALERSTMPILDAVVEARGRFLALRAAHLTTRDEADRMAKRLQDRRQPMAMLISHEPPIGVRVIDGEVVPATTPIPERTHAPSRQLDQVMIRPDLTVIDTWVEQDPLAYYASDHLPAGAEIELP